MGPGHDGLVEPVANTETSVAGDLDTGFICRRLDGKVALVTGSSRGIGKAIVDRFLTEGAAVIGLSRRAEEAAAGAGSAESLLALAADVRSSASVGAAVEAGVARFGRLDVVVNNAAVGLLRTAADTDDDQYDKVFDTNVRSIFHTARHAVPHLQAAGSGSIVNIGSVAAHVGFATDAAYCASKGAVLALTKQMANDYAADGIRVNCVEPGFVVTDQLTEYIGGQSDPDTARAAIAALHPIGRIGRPEEIAAVVAFLASEDAAFVTGVALTVDGGLLSRP
jgi:NAD(P)-dependent dehydrogenase (short-subunit alcohol dehydrogenase family)